MDCNIKYERATSRNALELTLTLFYKLLKVPFLKKEDTLKKVRVRIKLYHNENLKEGIDKKFLLSDITDDASRDFIQDVDTIICSLDLAQLNLLSANAKALRDTVLSEFFDLNVAEVQAPTVSEVEKEQLTDEERNVRQTKALEELLYEIYGPINTGLISDLANTFKVQLRRELIYNDFANIKYELTAPEINRRITNFKNEKFKNILSYLKIMPEFEKDEIIQKTENMYTNGLVDYNAYFYVIDKFRQVLAAKSNLNNLLNAELKDKTLLAHKQELERAYAKLIALIMDNPTLKRWFINKFKTDFAISEAKTKLFLADQYSNYYLEIKSKLEKEIKKDEKVPYATEALNLIEEIEYPNHDLLGFVLNYIILTQFDDLLISHLGDSFTIQKDFIRNFEPSSLLAQKYIPHKSKKHLNAGWETSNKEGSEDHTSVTVKGILDTVHVYKYNERNQLLPRNVNMTSLMHAWLNLIYDLFNNNITFSSGNSSQIRLTLIDTLNGSSDNAFDNIIKIFEYLYDPKATSLVHGRLIDLMQGERTFTEQDKNILYSFFIQVLDRSNPHSKLSTELARINDPILYSTDFTNICADLVALLYRNVNNNYVDCDLRNSTFEVKSKFNWDSVLFDMAERITYFSRMSIKNGLGSVGISKYNYETKEVLGNYESTITLKGQPDANGDARSYRLGFSYRQGADNRAGLFSNQNNLTLISTEVGDSNILDILAKIDLSDFKQKVISSQTPDLSKLTEEEKVLFDLLTMFDSYLRLNMLSDTGLDTLDMYKKLYKADFKHNLYSANYLEHFLNLAIRVLDVDEQILNADNKPFKDYIAEDSKYASIYDFEVGHNKPNIFDFRGDQLYFNPVNTKDLALSDFAQYESTVLGQSIRHNSLNKQGSSVPNYGISRLGSELNRRLYEQSKMDGPSSSLLFVKHMNIIDMDPVIDSEVTTLLGQVKTVRDMTSLELFQHAILDKFYLSFINSDKICFLPTVYSDKTNFLNYRTSLEDIFGANALNLMSSNEADYLKIYRNSFFSAHNLIQANIILKYDKLIKFALTYNNKQFLKLNDVFTGSRYNNARTFLRNRTKEELLEVVKAYNNNNDDEIALESEKDFRVRKISKRLSNDMEPITEKFCDLNEVVDFYANLYLDEKALAKYIKRQKDLFVKDLEENGASFKMFDSVEQMNLWIKGKLPQPAQSYLAKLLASEKLLKADERETYLNKWLDKETGELIILNEEGELNPFLEKFFYIEGICSNNLRLSLSGSEINHPDKAKSTIFNQVFNILNNIRSLKEGEDASALKAELRELLILNDFIKDSDNFEEVYNELIKVRDLNDLEDSTNSILLNIYLESLLEIINTAEGTLFKRNVIIPATLQHPITTLFNGVATKVRVAVLEDMQAPVNTLREKDKIDSLDGSSYMSPILVILENNSLGDQRVGTNRKPIWDDLTEDLTSFLAKFAAFGITNAKMLQSLKSDSSQYNLFKKMHNLQWAEGSIDLTKNINQFENVPYNEAEVSRWFKLAILGNLHLYYKNKFGDIVEITSFGKENGNYYTIEKVLGAKELKVFHYFDAQSNHYTSQPAGVETHTINSLYELFVAMGGVNCVDAETKTVSEFSNLVLTNFVINVGFKKRQKIKVDGREKFKTEITSASDVVQPLKSQFVGYVFNSTAVKNGAKNINTSDYWLNDKSLNTFVVNTRGLGILLNADHDVVDSELTEFSLVVAACAAYGKKYSSINEIYYSLAQSAFEASKLELDNIKEFTDLQTTDPSKAKFKLYKIIGKLILASKSNNELDLTEKVKLEIRKEFKVNKDNQSDLLKIPFSDMSIYSLFITNITSVINAKSIKRKHPGSGYVMAPAYNIVLYFLVYDNKTRSYKKYFFLDVLNKAHNDFKGKLITELELLRKDPKVDTSSYDKINNLKFYTLSKLIELRKGLNTEPSKIEYLSIQGDDIALYNKALVDMYLDTKQKLEPYRPLDWFQVCDRVLVTYPNNTTESLDLSDMGKYLNFIRTKFPEGTKFQIDTKAPNNLKPSLIRWQYLETSAVNLDFADIQNKYKVNIKNSTYESFKFKGVVLESIQISLLEDPTKIFELVKEKNADGVETGKWQIHFRTGIKDEKSKQLLPDPEFIKDKNKKDRLFKASMEALPIGATLTLVPNAEDDLEKNIGLTKGSILGFRSLANRSGRAIIKPTEDLIHTNFKLNGKPIDVNEYTKIGNTERHYMNIYSHPLISLTWDKDIKEKPTLKQILDVLDRLDRGEFEMNGQVYKIIPGTLENSEAELVLGNMYKDIFQTENKSLAEILDLGEDFFKNLSRMPELPKGSYHLAFVKLNGHHVLVTLDNLEENEHYMEVPFSTVDEFVNKNNEIYNHEGGIKIGKYIASSWVERDGKVYEDSTYSKEIDPSRYRLVIDENNHVTEVLERVEYLKKYTYSKITKVNGLDLVVPYTLYKLSSPAVIKRALDKKKINGKEIDVHNSDALKQMSAILSSLYAQDRYMDIQVNNSRTYSDGVKQELSDILFSFGMDTKKVTDPKTKKTTIEPLTMEEIGKLPKFDLHIIALRNLLKTKTFEDNYKSFNKNYYEELSHYKKQYVSFLDSLHFISSRIPAQSLQSFMPMRCVGWTADTSNTAYVSYIQTYLLGSDYDIDKAYIMGQSYRDDATYIGWSPLFDYSSEELLQASKFIPVPRHNKLSLVENPELNIDAELNAIITTKGADKIKNYAKLINKLDDQSGRYNMSSDNLKEKTAIIKQIQKHEDYTPKYRYKELMYKNVASANIKIVVHDIRNRDQAYSPITMKDLSREAENSPKGAKTKLLNMVNPLTKYIMLNLNLVGKDVIGIAANGEKDWFNLTYYYHNILRTGNEHDLFFLKMNHNYERIQGRAKGINFVTPNSVYHIPDLWNADAVLAAKLKKLFYVEGELTDTSDKYVDLLISQLLSAATDNAKELILAKINAGTNLAKYHLHLMMMGFSLDDIVSFMTSPVVELIDKYSHSDIYSNLESSVNLAIKLLNGEFDLSSWVVAPYKRLSSEELEALAEANIEAYQAMMDEFIESEGRISITDNSYPWIIAEISGMYQQVLAKSLSDFFKKYIEAKTSPESTLTDEMKALASYNLPVSSNMNTNFVFKKINNIIKDINSAIDIYNKGVQKFNQSNTDKSLLKREYTIEDFKLDLNEFSKLTLEANETSTLASVWLKLNQGIPQTDIDLIKLLKKMNGTISGPEKKFKVKRASDAKRSQSITLMDDEDFREEAKGPTKADLLEILNNLVDDGENSWTSSVNTTASNDLIKTLTLIYSNNKSLSKEEIIQIVKDAIEADIYGNFDIYKFLNDDPVIISESSFINYSTRSSTEPNVVSYREAAAVYFNLLKSSWNILDMVRRIPHYKLNLDLMNYSVLTRHIFATKSKVVDSLITIGDLNYIQLTDMDYKNIIKYADKVLITSYLFSKKTPISLKKVIDDVYSRADPNERNPRKNITIYNQDYDEVLGDEIYLNTLNGLDSFKHFVEGAFMEWLRTNYGSNDLVKAINNTSNHGLDTLRTALDLSTINDSLVNKLTFNRYLIGLKELEGILFDDHYTVADIIMLYNLLLNGTKLGGKYMTALFTDSVYAKTPSSEEDLQGTLLYDYYLTIANQDYSENLKYVLPTKKDFLIAIAPIISTTNGLRFMKNPYVKVRSIAHGFDVYRKVRDGQYEQMPEDLLDLKSKFLPLDVLNARMYNYLENSLFLFPEVHKRMRENSIFNADELTDTVLNDMVDLFTSYIRLNKLLIYKIC